MKMPTIRIEISGGCVSGIYGDEGGRLGSRYHGRVLSAVIVRDSLDTAPTLHPKSDPEKVPLRPKSDRFRKAAEAIADPFAILRSLSESARTRQTHEWMNSEAASLAHLESTVPEMMETLRSVAQDIDDFMSGDWLPEGAEGWMLIVSRIDETIKKAIGGGAMGMNHDRRVDAEIRANSERTPGPWECSQDYPTLVYAMPEGENENDGSRLVADFGKDGNEKDEANAAFCVRACNEYETLKEQHAKMLEALHAIHGLLTNPELEEYPSRDLERDITRWADEAIRKAEEKNL